MRFTNALPQVTPFGPYTTTIVIPLSATPTQLPDIPCIGGFTIKADRNNENSVLIGGAGIFGPFGGFILYPAESVDGIVSNLNQVWYIGDEGDMFSVEAM